MAAGLKFFSASKPCAYGHVVRRTIDGKCPECKRLRGQAKRTRDKSIPERVARKRERDRARRRARPTLTDEERAARRAANRKRQREIQRKWRTEHPGYQREWRAAHPEKRRAWRKARRIERRERLIVFLRGAQRGKCAICREKLGDDIHVDHIVPLARGGLNRRSNLQLACGLCNIKKGARDPIEFSRSLGRLL